jgi:hypothetical protein
MIILANIRTKRAKLMDEYYIFDIPIYRCTMEKFETEVNSKYDARIERIMDSDSKKRPLPIEIKVRVMDSVYKKFGGPWEYSQIVGWLKLYADPSHIGGHLWWIDSKILRHDLVKKRFYQITPSNVLSNHFYGTETSKEIYNILIADIKKLAKQNPLKGRFTEFSQFERVGPHIDWEKLMAEASKEQ